MPQLHRHLRALGWLALLLALLGAGAARGAEPVARAVLFYSPTCPHCHYVMEEVLPPLQAQYGEGLVILPVDVSQPGGQALYREAIAALAIPEERLGVPTVVFGETVLVGSEEIPARLPGLIEAALAAGGNGWPALAGLAAMTGEGAVVAPAPAPSPFMRDPVANGVALALLLVMIAAVIAVALRARPPFDRPLPAWRERAIPALALAGIAVAAYLATVELRGVAAFCGPVGDCNTVQQSPYARLFGVVPVGVLGRVGYGAILVAWALRRGRGEQARRAGLALLLLTGAGTLFSIYLTFLEPFVIGASCMWCLSSAALMTALLWLAAPPPQAPLRRGRPRHSPAH